MFIKNKKLAIRNTDIFTYRGFVILVGELR